MKIATWNINSVRLRLGNVERFLAESQTDVLCLQETKTVDDTFPAAALKAAGYSHQMIHGQKSYNGVAIISRIPFVATGDVSGKYSWCEKEDCRHIWARLGDGTEVHNFYIPAGGDIPDPAQNDKFAHKLQFLDEVTAWLAANTDRRKTILVGDLNIAPLEHDVWSHKALLGVVSHTPIEVDKLNRMQAAGGFVDAVRHFTPATEKLYSWWSYRAKDWDAADKGRRLDHVWVTPDLMDGVSKAEIHRSVRGWEQPSDHVPVTVTVGS
jgi:exodeoxyribonuclease III